MNLRDPSKTDTEKIHKIEFEEQNEVPFKFRKVQEDVFPVVTVETVLKGRKHNEISLLC